MIAAPTEIGIRCQIPLQNLLIINSDFFLELCIACLLLGDYTDVKCADSFVEPPKNTTRSLPTSFRTLVRRYYYVCKSKLKFSFLRKWVSRANTYSCVSPRVDTF